MKRTGGGGAWRAFLHCRCQGQLVRDFSALAVQYGALSAEELEHFRILGRDGSKIHWYGGRSFGPRLATVEKLIEYKKMAEKGEAVLCNALVQSAQSALALPDTLSDAALGQSMNKTRGRAIRSMNTPIGKFSQYKDGSLVATCPIVECGQRCRLTKRLYASNDGKNPGQGRFHRTHACLAETWTPRGWNALYKSGTADDACYEEAVAFAIRVFSMECKPTYQVCSKFLALKPRSLLKGMVHTELPPAKDYNEFIAALNPYVNEDEMQHVIGTKLYQESEQDLGEYKSKVAQQIAEAQKLVTCLGNVGVGLAEAALKQAVDSASPLAGGGVNGKSWYESVKPKMKLPVVVEIAADTPMQRQLKEYEEAQDTMMQAIAMYENTCSHFAKPIDDTRMESAKKVRDLVVMTIVEYLIVVLTSSARPPEEKKKTCTASRQK